MFSVFSRRVLPMTGMLTAVLIGAAACGGGGDGAADGKTKVIGSFYPAAWLAQRVGGADVQVSTLTKPGAEPHDLELTPKQVAEVGDATFVVYVKGVQPAVDEAVEQRAKDHSLDAASVVKTLPAPVGGEEEEHAGEEEHADVTYDPHIWLDPSRMATIATTLGDRLAAVDSAHAADYRSGAKTLAAQLTALDGEYRTGLARCTRKTIVTSHAAFGYLADRYGLKQVPVAGVDPNNEPSPKRLAELTREIKANGATTVFTETLVSPKVAESLAKEAGVKTATLDPIEGVEAGSKDDYLSIMRSNLQTLRTALGCT